MIHAKDYMEHDELVDVSCAKTILKNENMPERPTDIPSYHLIHIRGVGEDFRNINPMICACSQRPRMNMGAGPLVGAQ